jgi:dTDP-4-dehydrorhamnose reductase
MTDTVSAETTENGKNLSYKLNAQFLNHLATVCKIFKTKLIHISTDYVFSELCNPCINIDTHSYLYGFSPVDIPFPKNNYGLHKLLGEQFIQNIMHKNTYAILRTSWLYGKHNEKSFVHKFLKNALKCCKENILIDVTNNEYSIPTSTTFLSYYIYGVIN